MNRVLLAALAAVLLATACDHDTSTTTPTATPASASGRPTPAPSSTRPTPFVPTRVHATTTAWRLPYPVAREAAVPTGHGSVVLAGGLAPGDTTTSRSIRVDLATGHAEALPPLPVPVHDTAAGLVDGRPTVAGGGNSAEQDTVQSLRHGTWHQVGRLPTTRSDLSVVDWRHRAYVIGGYDGASEPTGVLALAGSGPPHRVGALVRGVRYAATARLGSRVFVIGGEVDGRELGTIQRVDLSTGRTRPAGHLPVPVGHAMAAAVGGRILVMGGRTSPTRQTGRMWWYDPVTRKVRAAGRLPTPLSDAGATSRGHHIWLLGGETPAVTDAVTTLQLR